MKKRYFIIITIFIAFVLCILLFVFKFNNNSYNKNVITVEMKNPISLHEISLVEENKEFSPIKQGFSYLDFNDNPVNACIIGTDYLYQNIAKINIINGRFLYKDEENVCVIDENLAYKIFGNTEVINVEVSIDGNDFLVVGVCEKLNNQPLTYIPIKNYVQNGDDIYAICFDRTISSQSMENELTDLQISNDSVKIYNPFDINGLKNSVMKFLIIMCLLVAICAFIYDIYIVIKNEIIHTKTFLNDAYLKDGFLENKAYYNKVILKILADIIVIFSLIFIIIKYLPI